MAHMLVVEGLGIVDREKVEAEFEPMGHEVRAAIDEDYKRATWGRRPEDVAAIKAVTGELAGRR